MKVEIDIPNERADYFSILVDRFFPQCTPRISKKNSATTTFVFTTDTEQEVEHINSLVDYF